MDLIPGYALSGHLTIISGCRQHRSFGLAISMPSAASIEAAAHPEPSKYLYFVSRGDGTSEFSTNLRDHNRAVNRFILKRGAPAKSVQADKPASTAEAPQNASKPASVE